MCTNLAYLVNVLEANTILKSDGLFWLFLASGAYPDVPGFELRGGRGHSDQTEEF